MCLADLDAITPLTSRAGLGPWNQRKAHHALFANAGVAFAIPTKIIFAHIGLFEFLDSDSFPKPPKLSKDQSELLAASIVGLVFGSFMTVIFILAT